MRQEWMSAEEWLTILLCRLHRGDAIDEQIRQIVENEDVDTERLEKLCVGQRIYPQLADAIVKTALGTLYSPEQVQKYEVSLRFNDFRYLKYEQELKRIQDGMDVVGIRMVVFKGLSYYGTLYPSRRQRSLGDFDIIVDRKDLVASVRRLEELGYRTMEKNEGWTDDMYVEETAETLHVAQMMNEKGYEVEVHIGTYYYTGLNLADVYDRAVEQRAGIRVPRLEDIFLIACVHAWHHFPIRKNPLRTEFNLLGHLLDVYVGYQRMLQEYTKEEILKMAADNEVENIVRFMIHTAYHILDPGDNPMPISQDMERLLNWKWGDQEAAIERRFLRPEETADCMEARFEEGVSVVRIPKELSADTLPYRLCVRYQDSEAKWPCNILDAGDTVYPPLWIDFGISWSQEALRVTFIPSENLQWLSGTTTFDYFLSHLVVRVGDSYEKEPHYVALQVADGRLRAYCWPEGKAWDVVPSEQPAVQCQSRASVYTAEIPWTLLEVSNVQAGKELYLDIQAHMAYVRETKYVDVAWIAGNCGCMWNEVEDCRYLGRAILG